MLRFENEFFSCEVNEDGAELYSLKSKKTDIEYIWQGDEAIWYGRSPILFPIIGRLLDDKYRYNGIEYTMPKHGFARKRRFELISQEASSAVFSLKDDIETLKVYPFKFELQVRFSLTDDGLTVEHKVINKNDNTMFFSLGGHPGFNCEIGDYLEFSESESLYTQRIDDTAILMNESFPLLKASKIIDITKELFEKDALMLCGMNSDSISIKSQKHGRVVRFDFGKAPYLGIWAKPAAPYVCIEPWYGINDSYEKKDDISKKTGIQSLEANKEFSFSWTVHISE